MRLLRWLATSQAAEDINSDDELVHETILSPLSPATTIEKVLEKANTDYESESQKECQDILESIENLINIESLKEEASHSVDPSHYPRTSSEKKTPQVDVLHSSPSGSVGNSSQMETKGEFKRHSQHQVLQATSRTFTNKKKRKKSLWCSLPLSMTQRVNNGSNIVDIHASESKNYLGTAMAGNEEGKCSNTLMKDADTDACEASMLVGCSVRDLMRRKRSHRIAQQDGGYVRIKKVYSEGEQEECNILLPKQLDLHTLHNDEHDKRPLGSLNFRPSATNEETEFTETHVFKPIYSGCPMDTAVPFARGSDSPLQVGTHPSSVDNRRKELQCPRIPKKQNCAFSVGHCETNNVKRFDFVGLTSTKSITSNVYNYKSNSMPDYSLSNDIILADKRLKQMDATGSNCLSASPVKNDMFETDKYELKCDHDGGNSLEKLFDIPNDNLTGIDLSADATVLQNGNFCTAKQGGASGLPILGSSVSMAVNMEGEPVDLIGMTFCKKPPIAEWKDGASENASFSPALSCHPSLAREDSKDGTTGTFSISLVACLAAFFLFLLVHKVTVKMSTNSFNLRLSEVF